MAELLGTATVKSFKGVTFKVKLTRQLTVRMWIAVQLIRLAARICGVNFSQTVEID